MLEKDWVFKVGSIWLEAVDNLSLERIFYWCLMIDNSASDLSKMSLQSESLIEIFVVQNIYLL